VAAGFGYLLGSIHERSCFLTSSAQKSNDDSRIVNQITWESRYLACFLNAKSITGSLPTDSSSPVQREITETLYLQELTQSIYPKRVTMPWTTNR
jgi:hypothetical protein